MTDLLNFIKSYEPLPKNSNDINIVESDLFYQASRFSVLYYRLCELSGKWSDAGEEQIRLSFARILLGFSPKQATSYTDIDKFYQVLQDLYTVLDITLLSEADIKKEIKQYSFHVMGRKYNLHQCDKLNKDLRAMGSDAILQGGFYGHDVEVIYGKGQYKHMGDYDVFFIEDEWVRTPNAIIAMAAMIGKNEIFLRHQSIETIFSQKWEAALLYPPLNDSTAYKRLSNTFKKRAFQSFNIKDHAALINYEKAFIQAIEDNVLFHEIGHGIIQYHTLNQTIGSLAESSKVYEENVLTAILEILADLAPLFNDVKGPVVNMCGIAKQNPRLAQAMYYIYLSDTWFYDTTDNYMLHYSDLISFIMLNYVKNDAVVDFDRLEKDLTLKENTLLSAIIKSLNKVTTTLNRLLETSLYQVQKKMMTFEEVRHLIEEKIKAPKEDSYNFETAFWTDFLLMALDCSSKKIDIINHINQSKLTVINDLYLHYNLPKINSIQEHRKNITELLSR
ncbi:hypothetical protein DID80_02725 [Candidatus Marinamargulisbacteria bacterium SCGC AAA071-K20]|nr:hypothetical protein DID80_02725 [Candidatus Marinamargulisbacteria bacterium SCGC AAA071-K20]